MFLYTGLDDTLGIYNDPPRYDPVCPACGCSKVTKEPPTNTPSPKNIGKAVPYWCINPDCQHLLVLNYCWNCGTHLWKLGGHWTFHKTRSLNPYDVQCPHCSEFLILET